MGLLPDPEPRAVRWPIISVDDHLVEPPDLFEGRMPARFVDQAPKVMELPNGNEAWEFDGNFYGNVGLNAVVGRPKEEWSMEPARFDQMRPGCYDSTARVKDMDVAGIWASLCFPSLLAGFSGSVFSKCSDPELGLACVRAWNDWHAEGWAGPHTNRFVPLQIPWLGDVDEACAEIRRNAERGFRAVSFPEIPFRLGLASVHTGAWDPFLATCEETGTVVCLHTGSAGWAPVPSMDMPFGGFPTLFPVSALLAAIDWVWSGRLVRFPKLRIALSEGGIGWVPMLIDRLDYVIDHSGSGNEATDWTADIKPSEVLLRNFYFCTIDDPSAIGHRHRIGLNHVMVEVDYPHADSTWPDTQATLARTFAGVPDGEMAMLTHVNAARLFDHPLPPESWLAERKAAA